MDSKKAIEKNCIVNLYYRYSSEQNQLNNLCYLLKKFLPGYVLQQFVLQIEALRIHVDHVMRYGIANN